MSEQRPVDRTDISQTDWRGFEDRDEYVVPTVVEEPGPQAGEVPPRRGRRRVVLPVVLLVATCLSTFVAGGLIYALLIMTILLCHEMGHFLQARRYGVRASLPFFLPMPFSPFGTFGAVIVMDPRIGDRKALFDIGVTGPLAGLVPTLICCVVGVMKLAPPAPLPANMDPMLQFGDPLLLEFLYWLRFGPIPQGYDVLINPWLWAGWVGLLVTSLNLMPIGQLDGGHVLYAMIRRRAHVVAKVLLVAAAIGVVVFGYIWWLLMVVLLVVFGPKHPPTARDEAPLGRWRYVLGWLALAFIVVGFTPNVFPRVAQSLLPWL